MNLPSRRQFISKASFLSLLTMGGCRTLSDSSSLPATVEKEPFRIRRSLWRLSPQENALLDYEKAVGILKGLPPSDYRSWINLAAIHRDSCPHGNSFFLPWHRAYLDFFEKICSDVLAKPFALPYWDWSENSAIHPLFLNPASPLYNATREITSPKESLQSRFNSFEPHADDPWSKDALTKVQNSPTFTNYLGRAKTLPNVRTNDQVRAQRQAGFGTAEGALAGGLEAGAHNLTHVYIGGDMGELMSPLDPLFWVHHSNIDRLWSEWCYQNPTKILPNSDTERAYWLHFQLIGIYYQTKLPDLFTAFGPYTVAFTCLIKDVLTTDRMGYQFDTTAGFKPLLVTNAQPAGKELPMLEVETRGLTPVIDKNMVTFEITLSDRGYGIIQEMMRRFESRIYADASFSLQAIGLPPPSSKRGMIEFYIDHPSLKPPAIRSSQSPHFVGRVGFFGHTHHDGILSVSMDLAKVLANLKEKGWKLSPTVKLQMVVRGKLEVTPSQFKTTKLRLEYIELPKA